MSAQIIPFPEKLNPRRTQSQSFAIEREDDLDRRFHQFLVKRKIISPPAKSDEMFNKLLVAFGVVQSRLDGEVKK